MMDKNAGNVGSMGTPSSSQDMSAGSGARPDGKSKFPIPTSAPAMKDQRTLGRVSGDWLK